VRARMASRAAATTRPTAVPRIKDLPPLAER
jgi:hypothetical protein